jgi:hypothetical protein
MRLVSFRSVRIDSSREGDTPSQNKRTSLESTSPRVETICCIMVCVIKPALESIARQTQPRLLILTDQTVLGRRGGCYVSLPCRTPGRRLLVVTRFIGSRRPRPDKSGHYKRPRAGISTQQGGHRNTRPNFGSGGRPARLATTPPLEPPRCRQPAGRHGLDAFLGERPTA